MHRHKSNSVQKLTYPPRTLFNDMMLVAKSIYTVGIGKCTNQGFGFFFFLVFVFLERKLLNVYQHNTAHIPADLNILTLSVVYFCQQHFPLSNICFCVEKNVIVALFMIEIIGDS